jgi:hypothetical protein
VGFNDYYLEWHARQVLQEARAASARAALAREAAASPRNIRRRPAVAAVTSTLRALCARAARPRRLEAGAR